MPLPRIKLDIDYHLDESSADAAPDDSARFKAAAGWIASRYTLAELSASVSVVDDEIIHSLNREHLNHDWPTDVISFVFETGTRSDGMQVDGEIIASWETARRLSQQAGWSAEDELLLYVIHGLLHLVGLDDVDADDRAVMRACEQECLLALGVVGAAEHLTRWDDVSD